MTNPCKIEICLGDGRRYFAIVGQELLKNPSLWDIDFPEQVALVSSEKIFGLHGEPVVEAIKQLSGGNIPVHLLPDGEENKNWDEFRKICHFLIEKRHDRHSFLIALGGGVVNDIAGFAASVYLRGISLIQLPTTLLAQVDAAVGGKTAINCDEGKNLIGTIHQPRAVICDTNTLLTLGDREYCSGLAEVVKYGLIRDKEFFRWLEENIDPLLSQDSTQLEWAIARSIEIKSELVATDEYEVGDRALLNLGHTFAHAIEVASGYGRWLHGEAVAMGLVAAARMSESVYGFSEEETMRILNLLDSLKLPTELPDDLLWSDIESAILNDKKRKGGFSRFVLMKSIGEALVQDVQDLSVVQSLFRRRR